ncbi:MAG TPA: glutamate-cysteine ligase family protein [Candidatus Elarobacter sp.]|nr:glutamate-cysteine ligase family protein [Candidatus Elarobacter sp.]
MTTLDERVAALFVAPAGRTARPAAAIGAELELIPIRRATHSVVGIETSRDGAGTADVLRTVAHALQWTETPDAYGAPSWHLPVGGRISYEPGGQLEISSPVCDDAASLARFLCETVSAVRDAAAESGLELLALGVDPYNEMGAVPRVLFAPRYERMERYFDAIGPSGVRMMRQTASLQINVELGDVPLLRWRLLNALAPYLTAAFASSRRYAGADSGYASYRAHLWQTLDPSRTGLPYDERDPIGAYARFAEHAGRILDDDAAHLTTLFPEVRPRGYFELRSLDSMEPARAKDALALVAALLSSDDVTSEALVVTGAPDASLLPRAAREGYADPKLAKVFERLERLAALVT